jgi:hypothetical protein
MIKKKKEKKKKHLGWCCICVGLNCCCGRGTKREKAWGNMTDKEIEAFKKDKS